MKKQLYSFAFVLMLSQLNAQYQTLSLTGFTADVIANGTGAATSSTNASLDKDTDNFAYISNDFKLTSSSAALTYGLPANGIINSAVASTTGLTFQMPSYSGNNSLRLPNINDTGTLLLVNQGSATTLYVLAVSGSGASVGNITVNFADGTNQVFSSTNFQDWYDGSNYAILGIGRINRGSNTLESANGTNPRIYQIPLAISTANQSKIISSVTFTKTSTGATVVNIFAISAQGFVLSVKDVEKLKTTAIFPNPFSDYLNFEDISDISTVSILDSSGKIIVQEIKPEAKMNLSSLKSGVYTLVMKDVKGTITSKKVIKK